MNKERMAGGFACAAVAAAALLLAGCGAEQATLYSGLEESQANAVMAALLGVGVLATFACYIASMIFVKLFYADVYAAARPYFLLANMGQVFFFISSCLMTVLLSLSSLLFHR